MFSVRDIGVGRRLLQVTVVDVCVVCHAAGDLIAFPRVDKVYTLVSMDAGGREYGGKERIELHDGWIEFYDGKLDR
jgi:hypothetical protein